MAHRRTFPNAVLLMIAVLGIAGCNSLYYGAWERLGYHKRDLLVSSVADARDGQEEAKEQFASALDRFASIVEVEGGELESKYRELQGELEASEDRAEAVREQIAEVEEVSEDLFDEWEDELGEYENADLRRSSERQLVETRERYDRLIGAMHRAEEGMEPVLAVFRDQVLFLKHNLNARAVASLQGTADRLEADVAGLIRDMEASIDEADAFLKTLENDVE